MGFAGRIPKGVFARCCPPVLTDIPPVLWVYSPLIFGKRAIGVSTMANLARRFRNLAATSPVAGYKQTALSPRRPPQHAINQ